MSSKHSFINLTWSDDGQLRLMWDFSICHPLVQFSLQFSVLRTGAYACLYTWFSIYLLLGVKGWTSHALPTAYFFLYAMKFVQLTTFSKIGPSRRSIPAENCGSKQSRAEKPSLKSIERFTPEEYRNATGTLPKHVLYVLLLNVSIASLQL